MGEPVRLKWWHYAMALAFWVAVAGENIYTTLLGERGPWLQAVEIVLLAAGALFIGRAALRERRARS